MTALFRYACTLTLVAAAFLARAEPVRPVCYDMRAYAAPGGLEERRVAYQRLHAMAALQGILNREAPRLLLAYGSTPDIPDLEGWWYERVRRATGLGEHLGAPIEAGPSERRVAEFIAERQAAAAGLVVWDPDAPATSHVASALAGWEDLIPVTPAGFPGSLLPELRAAGLEVKRDLTKFRPERVTGSAKCDWYWWLLDHSAGVEAPNPRFLAYYVDAFAMDDAGGAWDSLGLVNHDYVIAHRGFFADLSMWEDETPVDDPEQPVGSDHRTLSALLDALRERAGDDLIRAYGFNPWSYKYSTWQGRGAHTPVEGEWRFIRMFSARNAVVADSDAPAMVDFANGSFWRHFRPEGAFPLNDAANDARITAKPGLKHVCWLMGDYDSSAWMAQTLPERWDDPARGDLPLAWMMNPICFERAPHILRVLRAERTPLDYFVAYEGLGYIDPNLSPDLGVLARESKRQFAKYGYDVAAYLITPPDFWLNPEAAAAYARFAARGIGLHPGALFTRRIDNVDGAPMLWASFFTEFNERNARKVAETVLRRSEGLDLLLIRGIQIRPSFVKRVMELLNADGETYQAVDARTFFSLAEEAGTG